MRFMIIAKATKDSEAGVMPEEKLIATMAKYHEELQKAGVLLDASGLKTKGRISEVPSPGPPPASSC
jgi:hypothetical protein